MNWDAIGAIGEFVGAIAVFLTLLYLARQVRDAKNEQKLSSIRNSRTSRSELTKFIADSPHAAPLIAKANSGAPLKEEEELRLSGIAAQFWGVLFGEWIDRELDSSGEFSAKDTGILKFTISTPWGIKWWKTYAKESFPDSFVQYIEGQIREIAKQGNDRDA